MATSENKTLRPLVIRLLRKFHAVSVENCVGVPGCPDVNSSLGWIELKSVDKPKRVDTIVRIPHPDRVQKQKIWALKRWQAGGMSCLLLKVDKWYLLFGAPAYFEVVNKLPFNGLLERCYDAWQGTLDPMTFRQTMMDLCSRKTSRAGRSCL